MGGGASIGSQTSTGGDVDGGYWIDAKVMVHGRLVYRRLKHRKPIEISDDDDDEVVEVSSGEG
jgi:aspartyl aminopeptidase